MIQGNTTTVKKETSQQDTEWGPWGHYLQVSLPGSVEGKNHNGGEEIEQYTGSRQGDKLTRYWWEVMAVGFRTQQETLMAADSLPSQWPYDTFACVASFWLQWETSKCLACMLRLFSCVQLFETLWAATCQAPLSWDFPGKNTGVGCHAFLQGIFLTQGTNLSLMSPALA